MSILILAHASNIGLICTHSLYPPQQMTRQHPYTNSLPGAIVWDIPSKGCFCLYMSCRTQPLHWSGQMICESLFRLRCILTLRHNISRPGVPTNIEFGT